MALKWGDRDKMICETCEHYVAKMDQYGQNPICLMNQKQFNPWQKGGGRGCPMWEQRIEVPDDQPVQ